MSENAVTAALRRMGYQQGSMTGHGFRAMARTLLDEVLQVRPEIIERQLAQGARSAWGRIRPDAVLRRAPENDADLGRLPGRVEAGGSCFANKKEGLGK